MKKRLWAVLFCLLLGGLLLPGCPERNPQAAEVDGGKILQTRCTVCHDTGRIVRAGHDPATWRQTIDRMMGKSNFGPKLTESELQALLEHLVALKK